MDSVSRPLHVGRSTIVVADTDLFDEDGRLVAQTTQAVVGGARS